MSDVIRHQGHAYILATSPRLALSTLTLKDGDTFAVFDRFGDMGSVGGGEQGVFHKGTRVLSLHEFRLGSQRPLLLSSTVHERNALLAADLTNPDIRLGEDRILLRGTLHVFRGQFLHEGALYSRTRLHNYGDVPLDTDIAFLFDADFVDVFQVRGVLRKRQGSRRTEIGERSVGLFYEGLDGVTRGTRIEFSDVPDSLRADRASFRLRLPPRSPVELFHTIRFDGEGAGERPGEESFSRRREALVGRLQEHDTAVVDTANEQFNHWIHRSSADLRMLVTRRPEGPYPYAGVPWFSTVFGRDGLITALQLLWLDPSMARGVLATLAALQADTERPEQDAEPGKILHEARDGEMAALGEVPYARYYGSADSTPLFVLLAARYHRRVGDRAFAETMWPHVERALDWIDRFGDRDGDGYVEYARHRPDGLVNQGWKDSEDSISHDDGRLAGGPIALCEVQAYVYAARRGAADLARALGHGERAAALDAQAEALRQAFERDFWIEELGTYALALDGDKKPCRVVTSNPGHVLFCDLAPPERAARVASSLMSPSMFSGWGIRTLAEGERRYNPMSYHNGSVWPHDTALAAAGMARYRLSSHVDRVMGGMFDAALFVHLNRLPELFCGFGRQAGQGPTLYPVACIPQAWASGAVFMLLEASLGIEISAEPPVIRFLRPSLPPFLPTIELRDLKVGGAVVDLLLTRHPKSTTVNVLRREGEVEIRVEV